jgi:hypothetical protein
LLEHYQQFQTQGNAGNTLSSLYGSGQQSPMPQSPMPGQSSQPMQSPPVSQNSGGGYAEPYVKGVVPPTNQSFADRIQDLQQDAGDSGISNRMISGNRTLNQQAQLYKDYKNDKSLGGYKANIAAMPGQSLHESGRAADVVANNPAQQRDLISMSREPWRRLTPGADFKPRPDPNHFQAAEGKGAQGPTPQMASTTQMLAPVVPGLNLQQIVQAAKRVNPQMGGQELFQVVSALSPLMNKDTQEQMRLVQLQMREIQLQQGEQRIQQQEENISERRRHDVETEGLNREKEDAKKQLDDAKLQLSKDRLNLAQSKWEGQKQEFKQKFDQAEARYKETQGIKEKNEILKQAYQAKNQALRAKQEAINAASNITDEALRKQFMDQANADYDEAEARYRDLSAQYIKDRDSGPAPNGGAIDKTKREPIGDPKSVDRTATLKQAQDAIKAGADPEKVKAKLKELGVDPSALAVPDNDRLLAAPGL